MRAEEMPLLVENCGDKLYGFCRRLVHSKDDADELFQQTFLRAMELCGKIDLSRNPQCYLFGIALRIRQGKYNKEKRRERIAPQKQFDTGIPSPEAPSAQDEAQQRMLARQLSLLADGLPDKLRTVLIMFYGSSFSIEEIAAALKLPKGTVKSRLFKARALLKKELEDDGYESYE